MAATTTIAIVGTSTKPCLTTRSSARKPPCNRRIGYVQSITLPRTGATTHMQRITTSNRSNVAIFAARDDAKVALMAELDGAQSRTVLAELVLDLEAQNPTESPTSSELLAGQWKFAYSGGVAPGLVPSPTRPIALAMYAGGFTPGTLGLSVSRPTVSTHEARERSLQESHSSYPWQCMYRLCEHQYMPLGTRFFR